MDDKRIPAELDFKGLRHSKIGYFKEVRAKIKELEKLNLQLAHRHNRLDAIFNSMSDGVTILDRDLNIVFTNQVQRQMFPDIAEPVKHCHQIFYRRDERCLDCPALKTLQTGEMLRGEHMFKKGHLANRFYEWTTSPIAGARGQVDEVILIMRDITERKEYEFHSMQNDRMVSIGFLATSLAHEINNPVAIMVEEAGWMGDLLEDMALEKGQDRAEFERAIKQIQTQGKRCKDITHKLLSFARQTDATIEDVDILRLLEELIELSAQRAKYAMVKIKTDFGDNLPTLKVSATELQQVFFNLINNAIDAMDQDGGTLTISSHQRENYLVIAVSDTGEGIPEANLNRIFDPFFTTKPVGKGTGLGLSICYGIIEKMGGKLEVESTLGKGTTFLISLPLQTDAGRQHKEPLSGLDP